MRKKLVGTSLAVLMLAGASSASAAEPKEDDSEVADAQKARTAFSAQSLKMKAALGTDARVKKLIAQAQAIAKLKDKVERRKQLKALGPQISAVRADAMKKAGIATKDAEDHFKAIKAARLAKVTKPLFTPGAVISSIKVTSFPTPFGNKLGCPDASDKWDFGVDKKTTEIYAQSAIADDDCYRIRAGRTATVPIPKGTKTVKVEFDAKVDIDVASIAFGFWSEARAFMGLRVNVPGGKFKVMKIPGFPDATISVETYQLHAIYAQSGHIVPFGLDDYENDMQEGEDRSSITFGLPPGAGATMDLTPVLSGGVDADMQGFANLDLDLTVRALKVTFMR